MDDTRKMLRAVINGQSVMKSEVLTRIDKIDRKLSGRVVGLEKEMKTGFKKLTSRLDTIGLSVAKLEDDAPTREEHGELEKRVGKLENNFTSL